MSTRDPSTVSDAGLPESAGPHDPPRRRPPDRPADTQALRGEQAVIWIDVLGTLILAAGALWFHHQIRELLLHAELRWGQEDHGARQVLVGYAVGIVLWLLPAALLCAVASLGMWRRWHGRWLIQATAATWMLVVPLLVYALQGAAMDVALSGCPSHCWIQAFAPQ